MDNKTIRENLLKWCESLESGQYLQCRQKLHTPQGYCCLGVAIETLRPDCNWSRCVELGYVYYGYKGECNYLPRSLEKELGLNDMLQGTLSKMNDDGKSFVEIAQYIRTYILPLYGED